MDNGTYRKHIIQMLNHIHNNKVLRLIYEYVGYVYLKEEDD